MQNMQIADVEVPATQTPPPPDPAHWPEDITYRRNEQGIQMREPPAALKAKAKGNPTPPPVAKKKPPPPKPALYPGIPVKHPPDGAIYPAKPASAATAWLDHPPTPPSGQSQEPSGELSPDKATVPVQAILGKRWHSQDLLSLRSLRRQRRKVRWKLRCRRWTRLLCEARRRIAADFRACMVSIMGMLTQ